MAESFALMSYKLHYSPSSVIRQSSDRKLTWMAFKQSYKI